MRTHGLLWIILSVAWTLAGGEEGYQFADAYCQDVLEQGRTCTVSMQSCLSLGLGPHEAVCDKLQTPHCRCQTLSFCQAVMMVKVTIGWKA